MIRVSSRRTCCIVLWMTQQYTAGHIAIQSDIFSTWIGTKSINFQRAETRIVEGHLPWLDFTRGSAQLIRYQIFSSSHLRMSTIRAIVIFDLLSHCCPLSPSYPILVRWYRILYRLRFWTFRFYNDHSDTFHSYGNGLHISILVNRLVCLSFIIFISNKL